MQTGGAWAKKRLALASTVSVKITCFLLATALQMYGLVANK